ncbi:hypothetical protein DICVIV_09778 [Dictyocaulus viviparus]|uniref:Uncharacterized protein n=1 Tax=Dictyocaulus viviparus TaxID=29172 RepID=A0A0D8XPC6_DICVI|nr:hypothetical protein DICVIV_09778 [Dictyocaulus viviparus]
MDIRRRDELNSCSSGILIITSILAPRAIIDCELSKLKCMTTVLQCDRIYNPMLIFMLEALIANTVPRSYWYARADHTHYENADDKIWCQAYHGNRSRHSITVQHLTYLRIWLTIIQCGSK